MRRESQAEAVEAIPRLSAWEWIAPPEPSLRVVVVLPVRNEADRLVDCLTALANQQSLPGRPAPEAAEFEVLMLANNCEDDSVPIARRFALTVPRLRLHVVDVTLTPGSANIGFVRRELMNEACRRLLGSTHALPVIASTDADTRVDRHWLAANLAEIDSGADVVGGRILIEDEPAPTARALRLRRLDAAHSLLRCRIAAHLDPEPFNPWPNHHQHFGASLAIRVAAYREVGGIPPVAHLEDDALVRALESADYKVRRSPHVRVLTSGRLNGRVDVGLSWQLRQWSSVSVDEPWVETADSFVAATLAKAALRAWWRSRHDNVDDDIEPKILRRIADQLCIHAAVLREAINQASSFGLLWSRLDAARLGRLTQQNKTALLSKTVRDLRDWLRHHLAN